MASTIQGRKNAENEGRRSVLLNGINIQAPIARLILEGKKTVETRTYQIPRAYIGSWMVVIETPGVTGRFTARMIGLVRFGESFEYPNRESFYAHSHLHLVKPDSCWKWKDGVSKFGWPVDDVAIFDKPLALKKRSGIRYSKGIILFENEICPLSISELNCLL